MLYLSVNDGSDTRINKEVRTLAQEAHVVYVGIGKTKERAFVREHCSEFHLIIGNHKSPLALLAYVLKVAQVLFKHRYQSIHVINENLWLILLPLLVWQRSKVVIDIFDSIFLRLGPDKWKALQNISYGLPGTLLVTDSNRLSLLPARFQSKTIVVENYPYASSQSYKKVSKPDELILFYNGSMTVSRGTEWLLALLSVAPRLTVWMAGWVYDAETEALTQHPQVQFFGVVSQQGSAKLAAEADYILSLYAPTNANNLNASPNKIYDAIQVHTPVIINAEVKVGAWVQENGLGFVLPSFYQTPDAVLFDKLIAEKHGYSFSEALAKAHTWEAIEGKLLAAHGLA